MLKDISSHSNDLEIIFWDCIFRMVKGLHLLNEILFPAVHLFEQVLQKLHSIYVQASPKNNSKLIKKFLILFILFNLGVMIGLLAGFIRYF